MRKKSNNFAHKEATVRSRVICCKTKFMKMLSVMGDIFAEVSGIWALHLKSWQLAEAGKYQEAREMLPFLCNFFSSMVSYWTTVTIGQKPLALNLFPYCMVIVSTLAIFLLCKIMHASLLIFNELKVTHDVSFLYHLSLQDNCYAFGNMPRSATRGLLYHPHAFTKSYTLYRRLLSPL